MRLCVSYLCDNAVAMVAPVDRNITLIIEDLGTLQRAFGSNPEGGDRKRLIDVTAGYLVANAGLIEMAVAAWDSTSEADLESLQKQHRELDWNATQRSFRGIAVSPLRAAEAMIVESGLLDFDEDELHMLERLLEFSKYLADTSALGVEAHPVTLALQQS